MSTKQTVIPKNTLDILGSTAIAHIATIGPNGNPQTSPIWFDFDGTSIRFSQTKSRQKYHNLKRDPAIAISITDPKNPFHYIEARGKVTKIEEDPDKKFIDSLSRKYTGANYTNNQPGDERVIVYLQPTHVNTQ